jgi:hypothetical protein
MLVKPYRNLRLEARKYFKYLKTESFEPWKQILIIIIITITIIIIIETVEVTK